MPINFDKTYVYYKVNFLNHYKDNDTLYEAVMEEIFKEFNDDKNKINNDTTEQKRILEEIFKELKSDIAKDKFVSYLKNNDKGINPYDIKEIKDYEDGKTKQMPSSPTGPAPSTPDSPKGPRFPLPGNPFKKDKNSDKDKEDELSLEKDGPAFINYIKETEKLKAELNKMTGEKEKLVDLAEEIKKVTKTEDLKNILSEINKPENNYSDKFKNIAGQLISNREKVLNLIETGLKNEKYKDLEDKIKNADPNIDPNYKDYEQIQKAYIYYENIIKTILSGKLDAKYKDSLKDEIKKDPTLEKTRLKNLGLDGLDDELLQNIDYELNNDINYDDLIYVEYTKDIEEKDNIITSRENNQQNYRNILSTIRTIRKDKSAGKTIDISKVVPKIETLINNYKDADGLKQESILFIRKYIIEQNIINKNDFNLDEIRNDTRDLSSLSDNVPKAGSDNTPEYKKYVEETNKLKDEKEKLKKLKEEEYEPLLEDIKNANSIDDLKAIEPRINSFVDNPSYFKDTLIKIYKDKENKINGVSNVFGEVGPKYIEVEKEMKKLADGDPKKAEMEACLKKYKEILDSLDFKNAVGLDLNTVIPEIDAMPIISGPEKYHDLLKEELKTKIKERTVGNKFDEETLINTYDNDVKDLTDKIKVREENIELYKAVREKIRVLGSKIKSGELKKDSEETKALVEEINNQMNPLPKELKDELAKLRDLALNQKKKITNIIKRKDLLTKVLSGIAGFAVGGVIGYFASLPIVLVAGGLTVTGAILSHRKSKKVKEEIQKIEEIEKPTKEQIEQIAKLKRNKKFLEHATWALTGATLGLAAGQVTKILTTPNVVPQPQPTPQQPNIKVGDSANGMDLTHGFDRPDWAINGTNAESLNQGIINDGQTVVRRIMDAQGNTYASTEEALKLGKNLNELTFDLAKGTGMDNGLSRAWVNVDTAMKTL